MKRIVAGMHVAFVVVLSRVAFAAEDVRMSDPVPKGLLVGDIDNIAMGAFNLKKDSYLFAVPKDNPPTDRGVIWGEMLLSEREGRKYSFVSIFDCGPVASQFSPYIISFSKGDKYLVVESGGEGGSAIDVFNVDDLFVGSLENGWNGTAKCVEPIATVGDYKVPVSFLGWDGYTPIISSTVPLNQISTAADVLEYEEQGKCCSDDSKEFLWDFFADKFTRAKRR